jgi:hypothetical protein
MTLMNTDKKYEIAQLAWNGDQKQGSNGFDEDTKAGMILHEIAYREAILRGATSSLNIRRYVGLISSKEVLTSNYPLEIIKAKLEFWGEIDTGKISDNEQFGAGTNRIFLGPSYSSVRGPGIHFMSSNGFLININIENQLLKCSGLGIASDRIAYDYNLLTLFSDLTGKGINFKSMTSTSSLYLEDCGAMTLEADMFESKSKTSFSLFGSAKPDRDLHSLWKTQFRVTKNGFENFFVEKGIVDGREISNVTCTFNTVTPYINSSEALICN